jgi:predicted lactoylglutathione lyase
MFSHIQLGARDLTVMIQFYDAVLAQLGLIRFNSIFDRGQAGIIWRKGDQRWPQFVINNPYNGQPATQANGAQISFAATSRKSVVLAWEAALENGGVDKGAPGLRLNYSPDFYAGYCKDPEGNKLAFVHTDDMLSH